VAPEVRSWVRSSRPFGDDFHCGTYLGRVWDQVSSGIPAVGVVGGHESERDDVRAVDVSRHPDQSGKQVYGHVSRDVGLESGGEVGDRGDQIECSDLTRTIKPFDDRLRSI
jgi:hypothetical protein